MMELQETYLFGGENQQKFLTMDSMGMIARDFNIHLSKYAINEATNDYLNVFLLNNFSNSYFAP